MCLIFRKTEDWPYASHMCITNTIQIVRKFAKLSNEEIPKTDKLCIEAVNESVRYALENEWTIKQIAS